MGKASTPLQLSVFTELELDEPEAFPGKGKIPSKYAFVGTCPSPNRPKSRELEPFGSGIYSTVKRIVSSVDEDVFLTNLVREPWPARRKLPVKLIRKYYPTLVEELGLVRPERILALGEPVAKTLCPGFVKMKEDHGTFFWNPELNAYVVPTYHFSDLFNTPSLKPISARDLERFFSLPNPTACSSYRVDDIHPLEPLIKKNRRVFLDIETDESEEPFQKITMIGLGWEKGEHSHIIYSPTRKKIRQLIRLFRRHDPLVIGQNLLFDLSHLNHWSGMSWRPRVKDTMFMAYCLGMGKGDWDTRKRDYEAGKSLSLKHLTTMLTDRPGSRAMGGTEDPEYLTEDVLSTRDVYHVLRHRVKEAGGIPILRTLHSLIPETALMYKRGVYVDYDRLTDVLEDTRKQASKVAKNLKKVADINWGSNPQVVRVFKEKKIPLRVKTKTGYSVAESVLLELEKEGYKIATDLLQSRALEKQLDFLEDYHSRTNPDNPIMHPRIILTSTDTGRPSMKDPNTQQVTRIGPLKTLYVSRWNGNIGLMDLDAIELRAACWLHGDENLAAALRTDDVHRTIASELFHKSVEDVSDYERKKSKSTTYGSLYLGGPQGLSERSGIPVADVKDTQDRFWKRYPDLKKSFNKQIRECLIKQRIVGYLGRIRDIKELIREEGDRGAARKIVNTPIQQLASDMLLLLMSYVIPKMDDIKSLMLFPIHDAMFMDLHPGETKLVAEIISEGFKWLSKVPELQSLHFFPDYLPCTGEMYVGENWAECESTSEYFDPLMKYSFSTAK